MNKLTKLKHSQIVNDIMCYIYTNIGTDINIDQLALDFGISKFHLHRIFKEQMGANLYATIKSIRLQKASNLLITNRLSTITDVANLCGYSSQTSFIRAFKERFEQTPKNWRNNGFKEYSNKILSTLETTSIENTNYSKIEPKIVKTNSKYIYYIRHQGYNEKLIKTWQKLLFWVYTNNIDNYEQIGIYHDNPIITPIDDCFYVAGISIKNNDKTLQTTLPYMEIPAGIYAIFNLEGKYGDILRLIQWAYHKWLPDNGYETTPNPSYTILEKNHFLDNDRLFKVKYYLPIRYM